MMGLFCHMIGLFCYMMGLFYRMIGLFCYIGAPKTYTKAAISANTKL